jgi:hypothetical protein
MSQPPPPSAPEDPQHDEPSGRPGGGRRPNPAAVAVILLILVLLLSLGAFLGVRAVLGADAGGRGTSVVQVAPPIPPQGPDDA